MLEVRTFVSSLRKDWHAMQAGLKLPWSSGAVEGQANRINTFKRQMYGTRDVDLLRPRAVPPWPVTSNCSGRLHRICARAISNGHPWLPTNAVETLVAWLLR